MDDEITGKLTYKDFVRIDLYRRRYSFLMAPLFIMLVNYLIFSFGNARILGEMIPTLIASIFSIIGLFLLILIMERRNYTSLNDRFHKRMVRITEKGIYYGIPENQGSVSWSEIKKGVFFKRFIILYTRSNQPLLIPKHFFSSSTQEKEWIDFIKKHVPN